MVTQADLPYIISDILDSKAIQEKVKIENYVLTHSKNLRPSVTVKVSVDGEMFEEHAQGDGQYDAFMNALKKVYKKQNLVLPTLADYSVRILRVVRPTALCETVITWASASREFKTRGLDSDQTVSAIKATQKMLNLI
ncbi:alpha-isopropylmalate synthase regulatory domain-containing protein [Puia sp. P3]|uniref:alpha-isopropylmalate synthase regulatory domain-containing protein n=1 Tax=Puia sp. P3 TaxID=3423952 RepID=UPI003D66B85C